MLTPMTSPIGNTYRAGSLDSLVYLEDIINSLAWPTKRRRYGPLTYDSQSDQDIDTVGVSSDYSKIKESLLDEVI